MYNNGPGYYSRTDVYSSTYSAQEPSLLRPKSRDGHSTNGLHMIISPNDMVGPSPVTSNGTESTEIEDEIADDVQEQEVRPSPPRPVGSGDSQATVRATPKLGGMSDPNHS